MKIEIWSDFVCPFCYLGHRKLELALEQFEHCKEVEIEFKSFELNPQQQSVQGKNIHQVIADKYHVSYEQAQANNDRIVESARKVGLNYDFEQLKLNNTLLAHQITQYAKSVGKGNEVALSLFQQYFEQGMDIGDKKSLFAIAKSHGLDQKELEEQLLDGSLKQKVRAEEGMANDFQIQSVPHFIFDRKLAVSGGQEPEVFLKVLKDAYEKSKTK